MDKQLLKSKTFWAGVLAVVTALGAWATGEVSAADAMQTITTAAIGVFLRDGIAKAGK